MNKSNDVPKGVWVFHLIWLSCAAVALIAYLLKDRPDRYSYIQSVVLTLTLIALVIYTHYTRQIQKAMIQQTTVTILPVFEVQIVLRGEHVVDRETPGAMAVQSAMSLKNIGNGTALNIKVESLLVFTGQFAQEHLPMKFEELYSLSVGEKSWIKDKQPYDVATARVVGQQRPDLFELLVGRQAFEVSELKIWFSDILGNKYVQIVHLGHQGIFPDTVLPDNGTVKRRRIIYNNQEW